jgi:hypothetical protein
VPLLRRGGSGCHYPEDRAVEALLLAAAGRLGDVRLVEEVLRVFSRDSDGESAAGGFAGGETVGSIPRDVGPLDAHRSLFDEMGEAVRRFGWARVGAGVRAVLAANRRKVRDWEKDIRGREGGRETMRERGREREREGGREGEER